MAATLEKKLSLAEYLELEKRSEVRHEFVDGKILAMAGEKRRHNRISGRIYAALLETAMTRDCEIAFESVKIRTRGTRIRYPDIAVSCAPGTDEYFLENPCFIAEVLSSTTEKTDLTLKLDEYKNLPGLERYALVSQDRRFVVLYKRVLDHWEVVTLEDQGEIDLPCLDTTLTLEQIYAGISFEPETEEA
jgi:Uma2 family endonuclease